MQLFLELKKNVASMAENHFHQYKIYSKNINHTFAIWKWYIVYHLIHVSKVGTLDNRLIVQRMDIMLHIAIYFAWNIEISGI